MSGAPARAWSRTAWAYLVFTVLALLAGTFLTTTVVLAYDAVLLLGGARLALVLAPERLAELTGTLFVFLVTAAIVHRSVELRGGGIAAARLLGAERAVLRESNVALTRLLGTVEALATASHLPVLPVYVLPRAPSLNLALLGYRTRDAAWVITQGALEHWTRAELEGAMGYALAQWQDGAVRLHLRLAAPLFGLLFPTVVLHASAANRGLRRTAYRVATAALWVLGGVPVQVGRLLQTALVRDRVPGWDARHPVGVPTSDWLRDALVRIARSPHGSFLPGAAAEPFAHAFLADTGSRWIATHPPLEGRIAGLDPHYDLSLLELVDTGSARLQDSELPLGIGPMADAFQLVGTDSRSRDPGSRAGDRLSAGLAALLDQPGPAVAVWIATALSAQAPVRARQLPLVESALGGAGYRQFLVAENLVRRLPRTQLVPLLGQALPVLQTLDPGRREAVATLIGNLVRVDPRLALPEYLVGSLASATLREEDEGVAVGTRDLIECRAELETLFALIAGCETRRPEVASAAYRAALSRLLPTGFTPYVPYRAPDWPRVLDEALASLRTLHPAAQVAVGQALEAAITVDGPATAETRELVQAVVALLRLPAGEFL